MPRLLHISDLHFGPPYLPEAGKALCEITPSLGVDAIVVSGDFTQRARRSQFAQAAALLDRLPHVPRLLIPGNHDVPLYRVFERIGRPHDLYRELICADLNPVLKLDGVMLVGLDSTFPRGAITNGRLFRKQLAFCREAFRKASADDVRIVVAHHHFAEAPGYPRHQIMAKSRRAMDCFVELGVEMILGGHLHRSYIGNSLDFFAGNRKDAGIIIVQCGTTTSRRGIGRERGKNTFNVVDVNRKMFVVTHYIYQDTIRRFVPLSRHEFPRPGRPFVDMPFGKADQTVAPAGPED
ncbi:MAG: metallophosphoesterase family protein [Chitinivibrionales bacterium]